MLKETMSPAIVSTMLKGFSSPHNNINNDTTPTVADSSLAIYDKSGRLIGYIPVFTTDWVTDL